MSVRQQSEESQGGEQSLAEARTMISAFMSVGIGAFGVTRKGKTTSYMRFQAEMLLWRLPSLLQKAEQKQQSVIIRPFYEYETTLAIVQNDDLSLDGARRLAQFSLCITETSPNNYQSFLCAVPNTEEDYAQVRRGMNQALDADRGATCAGRLAGTLNTKPIHLHADGNYPRVRLAHVASERFVKVSELRAAGLLNKPQNVSPIRRAYTLDADKRTRLMRNNVRRLPSYEKALSSVRLKEDGEPDRSAADLLFAVTCLRWIPPLSREEIAGLLMEHSEKAQERKTDADWYIETTIDEAVRRA
jgi:hypothetical protein